VVDTAIELFSQLLPLQDLASTTRTVTLLLESIRSPKLERNLGRKAAVHVNAAVAIVLALRHASTSDFRHARETFGHSQVTSLLSTFLKVRSLWTTSPTRQLTQALGRFDRG
jgi:hypothetical protein